MHPSPLTAIDSTSAIGETQEFALLVELDNQLAKHSPTVRQLSAPVAPILLTAQDSPADVTPVEKSTEGLIQT